MFEFVGVKYKNILVLDDLILGNYKITLITGPSGSGKTTLLRLLNKLISPTEGKILFKGNDLNGIDSVMHRRKVAMLSQNPAIFQGDVKDNLIMGLKFQGRNIPDDNILLASLEKVKLDKLLGNSTNNLSGGEKQRLALARLILTDPEIYLLDEPTSALDYETEKLVMKVVTEHVRDNNKTLIVVTHSKEIINEYSDKVIELPKHT